MVRVGRRPSPRHWSLARRTRPQHVRDPALVSSRTASPPVRTSHPRAPSNYVLQRGAAGCEERSQRARRFAVEDARLLQGDKTRKANVAKKLKAVHAVDAALKEAAALEAASRGLPKAP